MSTEEKRIRKVCEYLEGKGPPALQKNQSSFHFVPTCFFQSEGLVTLDSSETLGV